MFVDTLNAPPDAIGGTVLRVAEQLGASLIVTTTDCYVRSPSPSLSCLNSLRASSKTSWQSRSVEHRLQTRPTSWLGTQSENRTHTRIHRTDGPSHPAWTV